MTQLKKAVITGSAQGLGFATAKALLADKWEITMLDKNRDLLEKSAMSLGCEYACIDVTNVEEVSNFFSSLPQVDALINNAGIWHPEEFHSISVENQIEVLNVNVLGTLHCVQSCFELLRSSANGSIVNFSSVAAVTNSPGLGIYPASKSALETLTRQWAIELAPIRVNAVGPGLIMTEGTQENYIGAAREQRAKAVPLARVGVPDEVADVVSFLVSDKARYVNGQIIYIDGGLSAGSQIR